MPFSTASYVMWPIVIAVGVQNNCQTGKEILAAENRSSFHALFGVPDSKSIAEKFSPLAVNFKANMHLPISSHHRLK